MGTEETLYIWKVIKRTRNFSITTTWLRRPTHLRCACLKCRNIPTYSHSLETRLWTALLHEIVRQEWNNKREGNKDLGSFVREKAASMRIKVKRKCSNHQYQNYKYSWWYLYRLARLITSTHSQECSWRDRNKYFYTANPASFWPSSSSVINRSETYSIVSK